MERRPHSREELVVHRHSASGLVEAGVRFKVNAKTKCLLELKFSRGCLKSHNSGWRMTHNYSFAILLLWSNFTILMINWLGDTDSATNVYNGLWKNITHLNFISHYIHPFLDLNRFQTLDVVYLLNAPTMNYKDVVDDIKGMLERAESLITGDCCISSAAKHEKTYKLIYFNKFLEYGDVNLESLVIHVEEVEPQ
ncbi:hypothetical protein Lal_00043635, partial [Lupinus albus]